MFKKSLQQLLEEFRTEENYKQQIVHWHEIEEVEARTVPFPTELDTRLVNALQNRGMTTLYTHQYEAYQTTQEKKHFVAVTPTASGKTLCYNLPVLQEITKNDESRALYLFPTKALAQDQMSEINELISEMQIPIKSYTYDGDTPPTIRQAVRKAGHVVMTNPDMLHAAILPHHTKWVSFFEKLKYIVIDELHTYRGVFGSHVANVIRRLKRIAHYYGSRPIFICTSATIANPKELAEGLIGETVKLINNNGAPRGKKHFIFYNPPLINEPLNIRKSATVEVNQLAKLFLNEDIQTIVFARSRVRVEIILSHLQELTKKELGHQSIRGYRGGYLPKQRREIEKGLREGSIKGVVSTNALELGVDIGQLQVCIMTGYPGSIASSWQQAGRAGRRQNESVIIMVASSSPLDQYMISNPQYFFERSPESARINPDNLIILVDHLKCAAYELPFQRGELFDGKDIEDILDFLAEEHVLHHRANKWYWMSDAFPTHGISLRSASQENVIIIDQTEMGAEKVIGEMDRFSAMTLLHDEAIYLHEGVQFQVEQLDWDEKKAFVTQVAVDYFTDAHLAVQLRVLEEDEKKVGVNTFTYFGDVMVNAKATIFKKIKLTTFETIGSGTIHLPEEELHTNAMWIQFSEQLFLHYSEQRLDAVLTGLAQLIQHVAPVFVMCDQHDLHVIPQIKADHNHCPTIFVYDRYPGGIGLSKDVFTNLHTILNHIAHALHRCTCRTGCPSCIGTTDDEQVKSIVMHFIDLLLRESS
ncbi:DEAD/DEAH box helicase [Halalkalibacter hemicellulosilyticus]|uniref:ATP-dependent RNA helicase n=1 Tax=Halalkalibacter hemicellulosilyticusJCM 9152 TaxID=1236971 RepID=W4QGS5_9BACI|nr:DEAD/DEAH box helicase [Halalkalibacter hemicellulosilyticus]GAE30524.1 ATP-dependent RNA helicase [Halalkalibacter hemicellulosilyticusJCM 9152]